ncbi:MAG: hypothetical protein J0G30_08170 [Actinomycetales bacterium]|nr:hypothetical protein [Actinomycetales bacterium]
MRRVVRAVLLHPVVARPGYWLATLLAFLWGCLWLGHLQKRDGLVFFQNLPRWAFARGGTTVGAIYLTRTATAPRVLRHEKVHTTQWKRYGLAMIPLYVLAGRDALTNRFEVEAGLEDGGYRRATPSGTGRRAPTVPPTTAEDAAAASGSAARAGRRGPAGRARPPAGR